MRAALSPEHAIDGAGFFVVNSRPDGSGDQLYTRAGSFEQDFLGSDIVHQVRDVPRAGNRNDPLGQNPREADLRWRDIEALGDVLDDPAAARCDALLARVGLGARGHHYPAELSGGEQQRVAIARALANKPALVLADEPTGNLDEATADRVLDEFLRLVRGEGAAALVATHNERLAEQMDRVVRLHEGVLA